MMSKVCYACCGQCVNMQQQLTPEWLGGYWPDWGIGGRRVLASVERVRIAEGGGA